MCRNASPGSEWRCVRKVSIRKNVLKILTNELRTVLCESCDDVVCKGIEAESVDCAVLLQLNINIKMPYKS